MKRPALAIREADLPPSARELVRLVGWRGAMALVREMPGARIYCPVRGATHSRQADARYAQVAELAGERAAARLYKEYAGALFEVPTCRAAIRSARDRYVRALYDADTPVEQICAATGISRRQVFYVLKTVDEDAGPARPADVGGQLGLF